MSTKTKNATTVSNRVTQAAGQAGILLMTAAVTMGMLELPDRSARIVLPTQPVFAWANENTQINNQNAIRRSSEETEQHYISYSVAQRTPARSGRH